MSKMLSSIWLVLLVVPTITTAQDSPYVAPPPDLTPPPAVAASTRPELWKQIGSRVRRSDGDPVRDATVSIRALGNSEWRSTVADSTGYFRFDSTAFGAYDLRVVLPTREAAIVRRVVVDSTAFAEVVVPASGEPHVFWTVLALVLYVISIVVTRWHHIARSVDEMLQRQLDALETRLVTEVLASDPRVDALRKRVTQLRLEATLGSPKFSTPGEWWNDEAKAQPNTKRGKFEPLEGRPFKRRRFWEFWFWSRGRENAVWAAIHEIERQLSAFLAPDEYVDVYLRWASVQLRTIGKPDAMSLASIIVTSFESPAPTTSKERDAIARSRRALLGRALAVIYQERDTGFSTLMEWQNKASWLMLVAALFIGALALSAGGAVLFLAGAAGGFSSRLMRALRREDVPLDYGASWSTLYLSPLFGALAGWFGIALITLAANPDVSLLGAAFRRVDWYDPTNPITLAVAFMLGFSERLFDAVTRAVELHAESAQTDQQQSPAPQIRPPVPPTEHTNGTRPVTAPFVSPRGALQLPARATPINRAIQGTFTLASAASIPIDVLLHTTTPLYEIRPKMLTIPAGKIEETFAVVALPGARAGSVAISAQFLNTSVEATAEVSTEAGAAQPVLL